MRRITVRLRTSVYDILIGSQILSRLGDHLSKLKLPNRFIILCDSTASKLFAGAAAHSLRSKGMKTEVLIIPSGERNKSLESAKKIYSKLLEMKVGRDSVIVALGGGVTGDIAGFVSATYMRGTPFIQVPTTLLAQVDAGIGGKTGVNLEEGKNIVGAFHQPAMVFCDVSTLITLPAREIRNGLSEIIKCGVIKDPALFCLLEKHVLGLKSPKLTDTKDFKKLLDVWEKIIFSSASIKARVVMQDEKETTGQRMVLNFGHTIGHAIETLNDYKGVSHGEAIALGMIAAAKIAVKMRMTAKVTEERITALIKAVNLPSGIEGLHSDDIIAKLILDKKVRDRKVLFVLPKSIGSVVVRNDVPLKVLKETLKEMGAE